MKLLYFKNAKDLAVELKGHVKNLRAKEIVERRFPDGESYVRIDGKLGKEEVFVLSRAFPQQNENIVKIIFALGTVSDLGAEPVVIIPYLPYMRQDKRFQEGESFSLKTLMTMLRCVGVKRLITVDAHFCRGKEKTSVFGIKVENVNMASSLVNYAKGRLKNPVVVGPDLGTQRYLSGVEAEKAFLSKKKYCPSCGSPAEKCECRGEKKDYAIRVEGWEGFAGKNVLLLDDIISTGSTIIEALKIIKNKARSIAVGCTHGLFLSGSLERIKGYCDLVFSTNTIRSSVSKVSISGKIAERLKLISKN